MVKILHAADLHLDSAFGSLSEERARLRRQECRQLVRRLVDYANDHGADLMLLPGDLFDGARVYAQTTEELAAELGRFHGGVVIAPGNHDPYHHRSPYARVLWPENVHIFTENTLQKLEFPQCGCTVYGAAFTASEMGAPEEFTAAREEIQLLVIPGDVQKNQSFGRDGNVPSYFAAPTPGADNATGYKVALSAPLADLESGIYDEKVTVTLSASGTIY